MTTLKVQGKSVTFTGTNGIREYTQSLSDNSRKLRDLRIRRRIPWRVYFH
jgi:hypothetical protein